MMILSCALQGYMYDDNTCINSYTRRKFIAAISITSRFLYLVQLCYSKAVFLLKFAGLARIKGEALERPNSPVVQRPSYSQQSKRWKKISAVVGTVGRLKHQVRVGLGDIDIFNDDMILHQVITI